MFIFLPFAVGITLLAVIIYFTVTVLLETIPLAPPVKTSTEKIAMGAEVRREQQAVGEKGAGEASTNSSNHIARRQTKRPN